MRNFFVFESFRSFFERRREERDLKRLLYDYSLKPRYYEDYSILSYFLGYPFFMPGEDLARMAERMKSLRGQALRVIVLNTRGLHFVFSRNGEPEAVLRELKSAPMRLECNPLDGAFGDGALSVVAKAHPAYGFLHLSWDGVARAVSDGYIIAGVFANGRCLKVALRSAHA